MENIDFAKIEARILAHCVGEDIHTQTAVDLYGKPAADITQEERRRAKTINYRILYSVTGRAPSLPDLQKL